MSQNLFCDRESCPVEQKRRAMAAILERYLGEGHAPCHAVQEHYVTCSVCGRTPGWAHYADGLEKALDKRPAP